MIPGSETTDLVGKIFEKYLAEIKDVKAIPSNIVIRDKNVTLHMEVDFDQADGAYLKKVTGLGGNSTFFFSKYEMRFYNPFVPIV